MANERPGRFRVSRARLLDGTMVDLDLADGRITRIERSNGLGDGEIDADGRSVVPGLWDEHVHLGLWAASRRRPDLRAATSASEAAELIAAAASTTPPGEILVATGLREGLWTERPTRARIDAAARGVAVMAVSLDVHSSWCSSALATRLGTDRSADGMLREGPHFAAQLAVESAADPDQRDRWIAEALRAAVRRGVVGIVDLEFDDAVAAWARRAAPPVHIEAGVYPHDLDRAIERGDRTGRQIGANVTVGPLKVITDGSLGTRTAYCHRPYPGTANRGVLEVPPDELEALLVRGRAAGFVPAVHTIGDAAAASAIDVLARLGIRGRLEHAQLVTATDVDRMAAAGITASVQPAHLLDDLELLERYWPARGHDAYRLRSLLDAGVHVVFGSDAPVSPLDPWVGIAAAVTRSRPGGAPFGEREALDTAAAIGCSTRTDIAVGRAADLVLLDDEPAADRLATMPVHATLVGGVPVHGPI